MTRFRAFVRAFLTTAVLGLAAAGCAGSPLGETLQGSLEADPQLTENPPFDGSVPTAESTPIDAPPASSPTATPQPAPQPVPPPPPSISPTAALDNTPDELRPYVKDLLALDLLPSPATSGSGSSFQPNQVISRSDYAQWLFTVNNRFYADRSDRRIRAGLASSAPAFKDVPPVHPNFAAIQGLAEAGLIPSTLTGNSTAVNFRPEDPLTRKDLVLWKVPLDTRQALPTATVDSIKETWGFQDAAKIDPLALRALTADYQNGEFANVRRAFGYTTLFQPEKAVTQAEAAAVLWRFGSQTEGLSAAQVRQGNTGTAPAAPAVEPARPSPTSR